MQLIYKVFGIIRYILYKGTGIILIIFLLLKITAELAVFLSFHKSVKVPVGSSDLPNRGESELLAGNLLEKIDIELADLGYLRFG